jgi:hypothetical protein
MKKSDLNICPLCRIKNGHSRQCQAPAIQNNDITESFKKDQELRILKLQKLNRRKNENETS